MGRFNGMFFNVRAHTHTLSIRSLELLAPDSGEELWQIVVVEWQREKKSSIAIEQEMKRFIIVPQHRQLAQEARTRTTDKSESFVDSWWLMDGGCNGDKY